MNNLKSTFSGHLQPQGFDPFIAQDIRLQQQQNQQLPIAENTITITDRDVDTNGMITLPSSTVMSHIRAVEFTCTNGLYNVEKNRDTITINEFGENITPEEANALVGVVTFTATVPLGYYSREQLGESIGQVLTVASLKGYKYTVTFNALTNKCVIIARNAQNDPQFITISTTRLSHDLLGFTPSQGSQLNRINGIAQKGVVSERIATSAPMSNMVITGDLSTANKMLYGSSLTTCLMVVPMLSAFGNVMTHKSYNPYLQLGGTQSVSGLRLNFMNGDALNTKDPINQVSPIDPKINFRGSRWILTLQYH